MRRHNHRPKHAPSIPSPNTKQGGPNWTLTRKLTRNRRIFSNDESVLKSLFLAIREASKNWNTIHHWKPALQSFQLMFGEDRMPIKAM